MDVDEVVLSDTAKSKCHRMISQDRLRMIVRDSDNYWRDDNEKDYVVRSHYTNSLGNKHKVDIIVTIKEEDGIKKGIVITQKHSEHHKRR